MSPAVRTKKRTLLPAWAYLILSIFLFVAFMTIAQEIIFQVANLTEMPLQWSTFGIFDDPIITEHMVVSIFMVVIIIGGLWILDLVFSRNRK